MRYCAALIFSNVHMYLSTVCYYSLNKQTILRHGNSDLRNSVLPRNSTLYSVISYRINFGWIIIRHFYFDLISMEVRNVFSDFDLNFGGHSWTWIEAMKGFQEQMVSALAFKPDHFIKTVEHELILLQTLLIDNINFHVSEYF